MMTQLPKPYQKEWGQHKDYGKMLQAPLVGNNGVSESWHCQTLVYVQMPGIPEAFRKRTRKWMPDW